MAVATRPGALSSSSITAVNGASVTVHGIRNRGAEATELVKGWDPSNYEPEEGSEFVLISLTIGYQGGEEETLYAGLTDFMAVVEGLTTVAGPSHLTGGDRVGGEISPGESMDWVVVFEVPEGTTGSLLTCTVFSAQSYYFMTD